MNKLRQYALVRCAAIAVAMLAGQSYAAIFDRNAWLEDLQEVRQAFATKYANLGWAQFDSAHRLSDLLDQTQNRIERANSDADARAAFDALTRRLGDGHVKFDWPKPANPASRPSGIAASCQNFDKTRAAVPLMVNAPGYVPLQTLQSAIFPAGTLIVSGQKVGVIEIGLIGAGARPELCLQARAALNLSPASPCDNDCIDRIDRLANALYTEAFAAQITALKAADSVALLVDIAGNGGGNEWADAAARMLTPKRLVSERMAFVRGDQWSKNLRALETNLRRDAATTTGADRTMLQDFADQAGAKAGIAATPCRSELLWLGHKPRCSWLGEGFSVTGPLASADPEALRGRSWAEDIFIPMRFPYEEGVWRGPLMVLIDGETESSAEELAAVLQDNRAALIIGTVSFGAGCGHTDGNEPTRLSHSGATLSLPDCVYLRADGTNEVRGIVPDLLIGFRHSDSAKHRSADVAAQLSEALRRTSFPEINRR